MPLIYLVIAFHHFQHLSPSLCQVSQLHSFDILAEGIFKEHSVIELDIKVDGWLSHITNAKSDDVVVLRKSRVILVL